MFSRKVKLKFIVKSYYRDSKECIINLFEKKYNRNLTFQYVLNDLYKKFSLYKDEYMDEINLDLYVASAAVMNGDLFSINYNFYGLTSEVSVLEYNDILIGNLERQFGISKTVFEIALDLDIGAGVGNYNGIDFYFHTNEKDIHHNPHIHCKYSGDEIRVDLKKIKIIDSNGFSNKKRTKEALSLIELNQKELLRYWYKVVIKGESIKFKMYCSLDR